MPPNQNPASAPAPLRGFVLHPIVFPRSIVGRIVVDVLPKGASKAPCTRCSCASALDDNL
jgi:hypothetical protein